MPRRRDGAAAVARFYDGHKVFHDAGRQQRCRFRTISGADAQVRTMAAMKIWITDLSWNSPETGAASHRAHRPWAPAFTGSIIIAPQSRAPTRPSSRLPFAGKVLTEDYSAARLTFNYLKSMAGDFACGSARSIRRRFSPSYLSPTIMIAGFTKSPSRQLGARRADPWRNRVIPRNSETARSRG